MNDSEIIAKYKKYEPFFKSWYIKRFIGEGGFAKVFEIVRSDFGSEYTSALKIITVSKTKTEIEAMQNEGMSENDIRAELYAVVEDTVKEIQLMYKLKGSMNIVGYEDHEVVGHSDGMGWDILIKMELLTPLGSYIRQQHGKLAGRDIIKIGIDICKALEACQKYNIIHRDIKADNIFVSKNGEFKLGDFGIARIIERSGMELSKKGTFTYMAPEVYKGQTYTSAVDIYSLGIVLYRLLNNNRAPFLPDYPAPISLDARDHAMLLRMSGEKFPKPAQGGKSRLTEIVLKACAYRPEDRYSSPLAMRQELEAILLDESEAAQGDCITIYEEKTGSVSAYSPEKLSENSKDFYAGGNDATAVTEILDDDITGATEVLRDETEMPHAGEYDSADAKSAEIKVLCKNCGNLIDRGAGFCPICGASQKDSDGRAKLKKKILVAAGISAAAMLSAVIVGVYAAKNSGVGEPLNTETESSEYTEETQTQPIEGNLWEKNVLMADHALDTDQNYSVFGSDIPRKDIANIIFSDSLDEMPETAWDVSADSSGSVMAWIAEGENGRSLYIVGEGGVSLDEDASGLFQGYTDLKSFSGGETLHTDNVLSMKSMFKDCESLENADVSFFNTSNVTDMSFMFENCRSLINIDVSGFDTSNVISAENMFGGCENLNAPDISNFPQSLTNEMGLLAEEVYFFPQGVNSATYRASLYEEDRMNIEVKMRITKVQSLGKGNLYELVIDIPDSRGSYRGEQRNLGLFYVQAEEIYFIRDSEAKEEYQTADEFISSAILVCNENGKEDPLAEDEEGWHEGIRVEGDGRIYYCCNTLVTTGYFEHFKWEKGIGLVEYWSGYGAFADGIELYLEETSSEGAPFEETESETGKNDIKAWEENILMADSRESIGKIDENSPVLGSGIARKEIVTVTFLDTLDDMPDNAWNVSQDKNKKVMAWTNEADGGYNLFIGAEGGVVANEDSKQLFYYYTNLRHVNLNGCPSLPIPNVSNFATDIVETMGIGK